MIDIFFATNRNPIGNPPTGFGKELGPVDGRNLRFGHAEVDPESLKLMRLHIEPEKLVVDAATDVPLFGSTKVFGKAGRKMTKHSRDTLVYIHGFDFSFEEAITRAAEVKKFLAMKLNLFVFSWPSDGKKIPFFSYHRDREDVEASGDAAARSLLAFARYLGDLKARDDCHQRVHLMTHSMGAFALRHAVQGLRRRQGDHLSRLFNSILLMAADEDNDAFECVEKLKCLPRLGNRVAVYHTPRDLALTISDATKGLPDRLGSDGPENARQLSDKVSVIDVSDTVGADGDGTNHQYYRLNEIVRDDMRAVLAGEAPHEIANREYLADTKRYKLIGPPKPEARPGRRRDR